MSEPNVAHNSCSIEDGSQRDDVLDMMALRTQAQADGVTPSEQHQWEQEHAALLAELMQAKSIEHGQVERIHHLEQALDQSLACLNELRLQMVDQQLLETQLAATEEIANVQQQAILRLKQQLAQQQQALEAQQFENQERDRSLQELLTTMESLTQAQQQELEQLRNQISQDRSEVQAYQNRLEKQLVELQTAFSQQQQHSTDLESQSESAQMFAENLEVRLDQAQTQVGELSQNLSDRKTSLEQLETELRQAHTALQEQQILIDSLRQSRLSSAAGSSNSPEDLEIQLAKQTATQALLQHTCQELEAERDRQKVRITELETQVAEMQEQILRQAQQVSEYETGVQHWKDRCLSTQTYVVQLQELLKSALPDLDPEIVDVLADLQAAANVPELDSPTMPAASPVSRTPKVDLPDFLMRRRSYKTRQS